MVRSARFAFFGLLFVTLLIGCAREDLTVEQVTTQFDKYINTPISVTSVVAGYSESDDPLAPARYKVTIGVAKGPSLLVFSDQLNKDTGPRPGDKITVSGVLKRDSGLGGLYLLDQPGIPSQYLIGALVVLAVVAVFLIVAIARASHRRVMEPVAAAGGAAFGSIPRSLPQAPCVSCGKMIAATDQYCELCGADQRGTLSSSPSPVAVASPPTVLETNAPTTLENLVGNLYVKDGMQKGKFYPIGGKAVTLGRDGVCTIALGGEDVSREHAKVWIAEDQVWVSDLDSTNGTFVNGQRVTKRALENGDEIRIGSNTLVFEKR